MDADMRGDVVTLHRGGPAAIPVASEVQIVGALAANMTLTYVFLRDISLATRPSSAARRNSSTEFTGGSGRLT